MNKESIPLILNICSKTKYAIFFCTVFLFVTGFFLLMFVGTTDDYSSKISILSDDDIIPVMNTPPNIDLPLIDNNDIKQKMTLLEIPFLQNIGQIENLTVQYYVDTFAGRVFVTDGGITYVLHNNDNDPSYVIKEFAYGEKEDAVIPFQAITGMKESTTNVSSFIGNDPDKWKSHIPTYDGISLGEIWNGINVSLHAYGNNVEKIFTVMPGYDPSDIQLSYDGISEIQIDDDGNLVLYSVVL